MPLRAAGRLLVVGPSNVRPGATTRSITADKIMIAIAATMLARSQTLASTKLVSLTADRVAEPEQHTHEHAGTGPLPSRERNASVPIARGAATTMWASSCTAMFPPKVGACATPEDFTLAWKVGAA
jgi:hypothetical protein